MSGNQGAPFRREAPSRARALWQLLSLVVLGCAVTASAEAPADPPEKARVVVGLGGSSKSYLSIYLAAERTFASEGLSVDVVTFDGGSRAAAALTAGSVDLALASLDTVIGVLRSDHPVRAFYGGFNHADLEWYALPTVRSWGDMRGRRLAISAYGSLTDFLTQHVLRKHGLGSDQPVHLTPTGGPSIRWQALRAARVDAAILPSPQKWHARTEGFTRLGSQADDVAPDWPTNVIFAREDFLAKHPRTVHAFLRAHVRAIRLARSDREAGIAALMKWLKYERADAERAHEEGIAGLDERGRLPARAMPVFWEVARAAGDVTEPWPDSRFLDRRFIDSFAQWAPQ